RKIALRLFLSFWAVMSTAGLAADFLFRLLGIPVPGRPAEVAPTRFEWNYTTFLNLAALMLAAAVYWLYRNRSRFGQAGTYAQDVVCGMQVERAQAPASHVHNGTTHYFCSDRCHDKFVADPDKYIDGHASEPIEMDAAPEASDKPAGEGRTETDPVCGMRANRDASTSYVHHGRTYYFCSRDCYGSFVSDPDSFAAGPPAGPPARPHPAHPTNHPDTVNREGRKNRSSRETTGSPLGSAFATVSGLAQPTGEGGDYLTSRIRDASLCGSNTSDLPDPGNCPALPSSPSLRTRTQDPGSGTPVPS
ncbi:MAG: YHS domain-containing protein, partial [Actinomycetota bacterium]|nr:YHS domain-containing protein [Actinomycetota bacterium]